METPHILEKFGFEPDGIRTLDWIIMVIGIVMLFYLCDLLCNKAVIPLIR